MKVKCNANCKYVKEGYCTLEEIEIEEEETLPDGGWGCAGTVPMPPNCLNFKKVKKVKKVEEDDEDDDEDEDYENDEDDDEDGTELRDDIPENICFQTDCVHNDGTGLCKLSIQMNGLRPFCDYYARLDGVTY